MANLELLDRVAGNTMCDILEAAAPSLLGTGIWLAGTGGGLGVGVGFMGAGAASYLASNYLCEPMDLGGSTPVPGVDGCQTVDGYGQLEFNNGSGWRAAGQTGAQQATGQAVSIVGVEIWGPGANGEMYSECEFSTVSFGTVKVVEGDTTLATAQNIKWRINPTNGTCSDEGGGGTLPPEVYNPRTYNDPETNCTYNVTFQGFVETTPGGQVQPVLLIEGATQGRASGGRIGGCNFAPTIYMPDGGGGGTTIPGPPGPPAPPVPPGGDEQPWWLDPLLGALGGALLNQILDAIKDLTAPKYEAGSFTLTTPCDTTENGDPVQYFFNFPKGSFEERVIDHQQAILDTLQYHLNSKTPICKPEKPCLEGDWVTTRWQSDEVMAHSGRRLRKLFRYRSKSSRELQQLSSYWECFTWRSGNVCVIHKDAWWGTPQVWAESAEEGKRVIRFAGAEAGLDPDQIGRWEVSGSRSPRYGMPGTMRILQHKGFPWVASRDSADWPNVMAKEA